MNSVISIKRTAIVGAVALLASVALPAVAMPLTGSGNNLAIPASNPGSIPGVPAHNANTTGNNTAFSTVWGTDVQAPWRGTVTGTGPDPFGPATGTTNYSFTSLNVGFLAPGAYVFLHDIDQNGESVTVRAYDVLGDIITQEWLGEAAAVNLNGSTTVGATRTPGWAFSGGQYQFNGNSVSSSSGSVNVLLPTLVDIFSIELVRPNVNARVRVTAPQQAVSVPLPATGVMMLLGLLLVRRTPVRG